MPRLLSFTFVLLFAVTRARACAAEGEWVTWQTASVGERAGTPQFLVDGKPFFVYGAAYFYERIPKQYWRQDLTAYRAMGINTIDLYVMWNWHEPQQGTIDFDGSTSPQRDLNGLLAIIHDLHLHVILRPGPVIRNEWKNGGYPDWLLQRPEYNMPLHDVLEGRYPATATLQNAHADAAAAEWMSNNTHMTEAAAWLRTALIEVEPYAHDVLAIALDDDQGAYIDNDTWPAPHWHAYMDYLRDQVRRTAGDRVPLFINTFQMKVTASAPVWAWGNWYQSDAYRIGDHDIAQLTFSSALLGTQPDLPMMASEFQAGWLQGADELAPRPAAPANTTIALHQMLQLGMHGVVNFPVQDTVDPPGYEAPWTNIVYAWDAAFSVNRCGDAPCRNARFTPTAAFGTLIAQHGEAIAALAPASDVAIAWLPSAYDESTITNADIARLADSTTQQLSRCRALRLQCRLVDPRYGKPVRERYLVVDNVLGRPFVASVDTRLASIARGAIRVSNVDAAVQGGLRPHLAMRDSALLVEPGGRLAMLDVMNPGQSAVHGPAYIVRWKALQLHVPPLAIPAGGACNVFFGPSTSVTCTPAEAVSSATPEPLDPQFASQDRIDLKNGNVRLTIVPDAGARAFFFGNDASGNAFNSIGAFRDDVADPPAPSKRDYIAPYTHPLPAGTFNRAYRCAVNGTVATCRYTAPDLGPQPVTFTKIFELGDDALRVTIRSNAPGAVLSAFAPSAAVDERGTQRTVTTKDGYVLVRSTYPANADAVFTVKLQGGAARAPKRP